MKVIGDGAGEADAAVTQPAVPGAICAVDVPEPIGGAAPGLALTMDTVLDSAFFRDFAFAGPQRMSGTAFESCYADCGSHPRAIGLTLFRRYLQHDGIAQPDWSDESPLAQVSLRLAGSALRDPTGNERYHPIVAAFLRFVFPAESAPGGALLSLCELLSDRFERATLDPNGSPHPVALVFYGFRASCEIGVGVHWIRFVAEDGGVLIVAGPEASRALATPALVPAERPVPPPVAGPPPLPVAAAGPAGRLPVTTVEPRSKDDPWANAPPSLPGRGLLARGARLYIPSSGLECVVESRRGEGGQGEVWSVLVGGERYAVKWYNDRMLALDAEGLQTRIRKIIAMPSPSERFAWPFALVTADDSARFGYLMPYVPDDFRLVGRLIEGQEPWPGFRVVARIAVNMAHAFRQIHLMGLSYQDVNPNNVMYDAKTGEVRVIDNDNVDIDGRPSLMGGFPGYQAPELVDGIAGPSQDTDLHSLAVMLFRLLLDRHPLEGLREERMRNIDTPEARRALYGRDACFVFDPRTPNRPENAELNAWLLALWPALPVSLRRAFTQAFTDGLRDPRNQRVRTSEWLREFSLFHDAVVSCPHCGQENFHDPARLEGGERQFACWSVSCGRPIGTAPLRIGLRPNVGTRASRLPVRVVVLDPGATIHRHHLGHGTEVDYSVPVGRVERHSDGRIRLVNLSSDEWKVVPSGGDDSLARAVPPGGVVQADPGITVHFPGAAGVVRAD